MLNNADIFYLEDARIAKEKLHDLGVFLSCEINNDSVTGFIKVLMKNDMLYYFEEEAQLAVNDEGVNLFTLNQATLLNLIIERFKEKPIFYNKLFSEIENNLSFYVAI